MRSFLVIFCLFFVEWLLTAFVHYYLPWVLLPDLFLVSIVYLRFVAPQLPVWRTLLPISLLMDMGAAVPLGFHGLLYVVVAFVAYGIRAYWQRAPVFEQLLAVTIISAGFIIVKFMAYYFLFGIPAPHDWYWTLLAQIAIWPFVRYLTLWVVMRFLPRALAS